MIASQLDLTPATADQVVDAVIQGVVTGRGTWIANLNLHGLYLYLTDEGFRRYTAAADMRLIDGWPLLQAARLNQSGLSGRHRVGSTDWLDLLMSTGHRLKILAVGGSPESAADAARHIRARSSLMWEAVDGYEFRHRTPEADERSLSAMLDESDVVLVGMGMPAQERWILDHASALTGKVVANVGGCFDYYSGAQALAPRWLGALGLEWIYRLAKDPRRLWRRYLVEPLHLLAILTRARRAGNRRA